MLTLDIGQFGADVDTEINNFIYEHWHYGIPEEDADEQAQVVDEVDTFQVWQEYLPPSDGFAPPLDELPSVPPTPIDMQAPVVPSADHILQLHLLELQNQQHEDQQPQQAVQRNTSAVQLLQQAFQQVKNLQEQLFQQLQHLEGTLAVTLWDSGEEQLEKTQQQVQLAIQKLQNLPQQPGAQQIQQAASAVQHAVWNILTLKEEALGDNITIHEAQQRALQKLLEQEDGAPEHGQQKFPRAQRLRLNLTALSQKYNVRIPASW